ncbi:MAG: deoxyribonuclease IV [Candidatus Magasanikbacteria bacterium]
MNLGAHKSISGGFDKAVERVNDIGGNALQIFSTSPRRWLFPEKTEEEVNDFLQIREKLEVNPVYFHASYLINLANFGEVANKSKQSLIHELNLASKCNIEGSVVHTGSFKSREEESLREMEGYDQLIENIQEVIANIPDDVYFLAENSANEKIGRNLEDLMALVEDVDDNQLKICLDTCHLHASGYDLSSEDKFKEFIEEFATKISLDKLELWHLNDSKDKLGDFRDRHENIGEGHVGLEVFKQIINYTEFENMTFIIETPGFDGQGPDQKNMDKIKTLKD